MPRALVLSIPARTDLDRIYDRVSCLNAPAADRLIDDLAKIFRSLTEHPKLGRVFRKGGRRPLRLLPHDGYLIFYFETSPFIEIARDSRQTERAGYSRRSVGLRTRRPG
jgi:plasmid stabilization system protein ParE